MRRWTGSSKRSPGPSQRRGKIFFSGTYAELYARILPVSDQMGRAFDDITEHNRTVTLDIIQKDLERGALLERSAFRPYRGSAGRPRADGGHIEERLRTPCQGVELLSRIRKGDLTGSVPESLRNRKDEAGMLAGPFMT